MNNTNMNTLNTELKNIEEKLLQNTKFFVNHGDSLSDSEFENLNQQRLELEHQKMNIKKQMDNLVKNQKNILNESDNRLYDNTKFFLKHGDDLTDSEYKKLNSERKSLENHKVQIQIELSSR